MKNYIVLVGVIVLSSCKVGFDHGNEESFETVDRVDEVKEVQDKLEVQWARPTYREAETILTDLEHTKLEVNFDWAKSQMNGVATITAKPHFYASSTLILDAKAMIINSVKIDGKALVYKYENDVLSIELDKEYTRDQEYTVVVDYIARPEEHKEGGSDAIKSDKGLYFINPTGEDPNVMPQIWTQGETEASSIWFPTIDAPNAKTTQEIFITVEDKYVTLSNGNLVSSEKTEDGKRVDHWKQNLPHAPYLFMMGIGEFKVVEDSYTKNDGTTIEVNYYVEPEWEESARHIFGETPAMIKFFSERLGVEYAWDKYHQIVVRDYVSGAMENTGAVIFGDYAYKNERELLDNNDQSTIAHELFHHWFGDLVTCESWSNLPLNESFANYSQYLWDEHRYGLDEADYQAEVEMNGYYQSASFSGYHNLIWFEYEDKEAMFDGHSYNKGGRILHMLRNYLGDDAFFAGLNKYLTDNKFKAAEFHHLRLAFEEVSGEDLNWFFNQWFLDKGHPELIFSQSVENRELRVTVSQNQDMNYRPIYKLPFEIAVWDDNGKHIHKVVVDEVQEEIVLPFQGSLKGFVYDCDQMLLAKKSEQKNNKYYIHQFYNGEKYITRREGLLKGVELESEASQQMILDALNDPFWDIRQLALGLMMKLNDEQKVVALTKVKTMIEKDPKSGVRVAALNAIKVLMEDNEELSSIFAHRVGNDLSYSVVTKALKELGALDSDQAMSLAANLEQEKSSSMLYGISQLYAAHGDASKFEFLKTTLLGNDVQGFDKLGVLNSMTLYLTRQESTLVEEALPLYEKQAENSSYYMSFVLPQNLDYLNGFFTSKIVELNEELEGHEQNKDALYADQTREKIKKWEELQEKYRAISEKMKK